MSQKTYFTISGERWIDTKMNLIFSEPHLTVHPSNPNHLLIGTMFFNPTDEKDYGCMSMSSKDGGRNWKYFKFPIKEGADPWCEILSTGEAVFSVLGLDSLYVFHSSDGGTNWNIKVTNLGNSHDHETMVVDSTNSLYKGSIYLTSIQRSAIFLTRSIDGGKTFPFQNTFRFSNLNSNVMTPVILSDGTLVIPFNTFQRNGIGKSVWLDESLSWMITSKDGGASFGTPSFISQSGGKGFPTMAVDATKGIYKDRLYWVNANERDKMIYMHYSPDKGQSWSNPIPIRKYVTKDQPSRSPFIGVPTVAVNNLGIVGLIWQDRQQDTSGQCQNLYFTFSQNGGQSFEEPTQVSTAPSCPEVGGRNGWVGTRWRAGGDYLGLVPMTNGNFKAVWADSRSGIFQLYIADIVKSIR